ncbi:uncharacterized protein LOC128238669 [Mya arenaria]|uniref:uncharacterized protein LOC128238669 n=1 Tax=Mya arenaria TaxID=6604 RepID=UPI0022DF9A55|nr:uncharacterized protein LOC128238669 [Mya arenaria]
MADKNFLSIDAALKNAHQSSCEEVRPVRLFSNISYHLRNTGNGQSRNFLTFEQLETNISTSEQPDNIEHPGHVPSANLRSDSSPDFNNPCTKVKEEINDVGDHVLVEQLDTTPGELGTVHGDLHTHTFSSLAIRVKVEENDGNDNNGSTAQESNSIISDIDIKPNITDSDLLGFNQNSEIDIKPELKDFLEINQEPAIDRKSDLHDLHILNQETYRETSAIDYLNHRREFDTGCTEAQFTLGLARNLNAESLDDSRDIVLESGTQTSTTLSISSGTHNTTYLVGQSISSAKKGNSISLGNTCKTETWQSGVKSANVRESSHEHLHCIDSQCKPDMVKHTESLSRLSAHISQIQKIESGKNRTWEFTNQNAIQGTLENGTSKNCSKETLNLLRKRVLAALKPDIQVSVSPSDSCEDTVKSEQAPLALNDLLHENEPARVPGPSIYLHSLPARVSTSLTKLCSAANTSYLTEKSLPVSGQVAIGFSNVESCAQTATSNVLNVSSSSSSYIPLSVMSIIKNAVPNASPANVACRNGPLHTSHPCSTRFNDLLTPSYASPQNLQRPKLLGYLLPNTSSTASTLAKHGMSKTVNQVTHSPLTVIRCVNPLSALSTGSRSLPSDSIDGNGKIQSNEVCSVASSKPTLPDSHSLTRSQISSVRSPDIGKMLVEKEVSFKSPLTDVNRAVVPVSPSTNSNVKTTTRLRKKCHGPSLHNSADNCSQKEHSVKILPLKYANTNAVNYDIFRSRLYPKRGSKSLKHKLNSSQISPEDELLLNVCVSDKVEIGFDWYYDVSGVPQKGKVCLIDGFQKPDVLSELEIRLSISEFQYVCSEMVYPVVLYPPLTSLYSMPHRNWFLVTEDKHAILLKKEIRAGSSHWLKVAKFIKYAEQEILVSCPGKEVDFTNQEHLLEPVLVFERREDIDINGGYRYKLHAASVKMSDFLREHWTELSEEGIKRTMCPQVVNARGKDVSFLLVFIPVDRWHRPLVKGCCFTHKGCTNVYIVFVPFFSLFNCYSIVVKTFAVLCMIENVGAVTRVMDEKNVTAEDTLLVGDEEDGLIIENQSDRAFGLDKLSMNKCLDSTCTVETLASLKQRFFAAHNRDIPVKRGQHSQVDISVNECAFSGSKTDDSIAKGSSTKKISSENTKEIVVKSTTVRESSQEPNLHCLNSQTKKNLVKRTESWTRRSLVISQTHDNASSGKNVHLEFTNQNDITETFDGFEIFRPRTLFSSDLQTIGNGLNTTQNKLLNGCASEKDELALDWFYAVSKTPQKSHVLTVDTLYVMPELIDTAPNSEFRYVFSEILYPVAQVSPWTLLHRIYHRSWSLVTGNKHENSLKQMIRSMSCKWAFDFIKFGENKVMVTPSKSPNGLVEFPSKEQLIEPLLIVERRQDKDMIGGYRYNLHVASVKTSDFVREQWEKLPEGGEKRTFCPQVVDARGRDGIILLVFLPVDKHQRPLVKECIFMQRSCYKVFFVLVPVFSVFSGYPVVVKTYAILRMIEQICAVTRAMDMNFFAADSTMVKCVKGVEYSDSDPNKLTGSIEPVYFSNAINSDVQMSVVTDTDDAIISGDKSASVACNETTGTRFTVADCVKKLIRMKCQGKLKTPFDLQGEMHELQSGKKRQGESSDTARKKARTGSDSD